MENNKILISAHFNLQDEHDKPKMRVIDLMIQRDATFGQLLDSIKYGLMRKIKAGDDADDSVLSYAECLELYDKCYSEQSKVKDGGESYWANIFISMYDENAFDNDEKGHVINCDISQTQKRVVFFKSDRDLKLCDLGFISATRLIFSNKVGEDQLSNIPTDKIIEVFNPDAEKAQVRFPEYNISTRQLQCYDREPVEIIPPQNPPQNPKQSLWMVIIPSLMSIAVMFFLRSAVYGAQNGNRMFAIMSVAMGAISLLTAIMSWVSQQKNYANSLAEWKEQYENYIARVISEIKAKHKNNVELLNNNYPNIKDLFGQVLKLPPEVFSRSAVHSDFLTFRLGTTDYSESMFEIKGNAKEEIFSPAAFDFSDGKVKLFALKKKGKISAFKNKAVIANNDPEHYISNLPATIAEKYRYMQGAPCLYSLKKSGTLGIIYDDYSEDSEIGDGIADLFIRRMIFELCYYHSPENLQFVIFFPETENHADIEKYITRYSYLPHCRDLFENRSQFVFSKKSANLVLGGMLKIMEERAKSGSDVNDKPHIVFIVFDEYNLKEHAFAAYLPKAPEEGKEYQNTLGLSFVFLKRFREYLPEYCSDIINLNSNESGNCTITPYNDKDCIIPFDCDGIASTISDNDDDEKFPFRMLSAIYYTRISQNRQVPSSVSLFEQFETTPDAIKESISGYWGNNKDGERNFDVTRTLAVPIGKTDTDTAILDLHEKADGPHMLVAGTTGSGKSETIISYLIGLCMRFRPDEVNLMLVDMKGGGFTKRLGKLPHVVGKVTDIDGDENNTGSEYMLKRFLVAIKSEIKRRKLVIGHFENVDSIDGYIKKCRELKASDKAAKEDLKFIKENPLTHLILVVDEFTELKRFSNQSGSVDYMGEITTIARIGRSLGIHIILISQNIEGAITDDIRVNSKSRLCLKVATRQASKEMLGNDLAASPSMPGNGRAYLLVGTGSKFEYFQSVYTGVRASENNTVDLTVIDVEKEGEYSPFYISNEDNEEIIESRKSNKETQLEVAVNAVCDLYNEMLAVEEIDPVRKIFRDPLPTSVVYKKEGIPS